MISHFTPGNFPKRNENIPKRMKTCKEYSVIPEYSFIEAPSGKLPKCPSVDEWINKLRHSHMMKYQ